jgi:hypothetical protein
LQTAKVRLKKVCLKKNDLSWNLSGGAHTQGQTLGRLKDYLVHVRVLSSAKLRQPSKC